MARSRRALGYLLLGVLLVGLPRAAAGLSYVALGDSVAVGAGDGGGGGYVARYRDDVAADLTVPVVLQNLAVGGTTSEDLLTTLTTDSAVRSAVAAADLVTFNIGGNDILIALFEFKGGTCGGADGQDCLRQAIAEFEVNWPAILTELRTLNPGAMMRTMTYYNPFVVDLEPGDGTAAAVKPYVKALNETIRTAAASGVAIAEGAVAFNGASGNEDPIAKGYIDPDHIHPSPLGYDVLGEAFHELGYFPLPGTLVRIPSTTRLKDDASPPLGPAKRRLSFTASTRTGQGPANRIVPPPPGGPQDPRTAGAVLSVYNAAGLTTDNATVSLPAWGWTLAGTNGFRFKGTGSVTSALLLVNKIKVKGKGAGFDYTLDEPAQGAVAIRLTLGGGGWCAAANAKLSGTPPSSARHDRPGKFAGERNAAAPASCPSDGSTTTTVTTTTSTTSTSTTTLPPTCGGSACSPCGSCGDGFCAVEGGSSCAHQDAGAVCFSNGSCAFATCSSDAGCDPGEACVVSGGAAFCCALCP